MIIDFMAAFLICSVFFILGNFFGRTPQKKTQEQIRSKGIAADDKLRRAYMNFLSYNGDEQEDI